MFYPARSTVIGAKSISANKNSAFGRRRTQNNRRGLVRGGRIAEAA